MLFLCSCCSVGSRLSGATLSNEGLFTNGSNPLKTSGLILQTYTQAYNPHPRSITVVSNKVLLADLPTLFQTHLYIY